MIHVSVSNVRQPTVQSWATVNVCRPIASGVFSSQLASPHEIATLHPNLSVCLEASLALWEPFAMGRHRFSYLQAWAEIRFARKGTEDARRA